MPLIARFPKSSPPLLSLVANELLHVSDPKDQIKFTPKADAEQPEAELVFYPSGNVLRGDVTIARYLARLDSSKGLYGVVTDPFSSSDVDQWIDFSVQRLHKDTPNPAFVAACDLLNKHLALRSYLSGYSITLADVAVWASISAHPSWANISKSKNSQHILRWLLHCDSLPEFQKVGNQYLARAAPESKLPKQSGKEGAAAVRKKASKAKYVELAGAEEGKVVTRFPPEPSGYLHMGHVKAALLNSHYARTYNGKLILRFDDTNPAKESVEFTESIMKDLVTLGIKHDVLSYTSDYFDQILAYAEQIIKQGDAFVDMTPKEEMKKEKRAMIDSKYRNNSVEENLRLWEEMKAGTPEGAKCVLRAKIDMQSKNGCMRDPGLYRVVLNPPHHRTGTKYKVYPIYDFACPIVDSLEGVTHALRSSEYHDRNVQYQWMLDTLKLRPVRIEDFSRLNFTYTLLSKRKLQWFVDEGIVEGWDSPAFPTVRGILRRGLTVEALYEFILAQGSSKRANEQEIDKLWALNKQIIDPIIPRYTAIADEGKVPFHLTNGPKTPEAKTLPRHKKNPSLGTKVVHFSSDIFIEQEDAQAVSQDEEITLMDWGNCFVRKIVKDESGKVVSMEGELNPTGDFKTTKWKLTWLAQLGDDLVPVKLLEYDTLITKKKLEEEDDFEKVVNTKIENVTMALGDPNLRLVPAGQRLQLERRGYFIVDKPYQAFHEVASSSASSSAPQPLVMIMIPDGRASTQSHLTSKVKPGKKN
ncbi:glutamate--tRNA ligase [Balamuthia mandrillaris]